MMTDLPPPDTAYWKRKLAAFLHDTPTKCLNIPEHYEKARSAMQRAGFTEEDVNNYDHWADWAAAAADRLPFPASRASGLTCAFDGHRNQFHHPLDGKQQLEFPPIKSDALGTEVEQFAQPQVEADPADTEATIWRNRFFAHWRLWSRDAQEKDYRLAFLPADTRIPDHTIWNHMQIVSAIAGANSDGGPAFLRVQIGGVQEFIAQAKNTRDLWSGSYLISWLMMSGMKRLSEHVGPDAVIFPNLIGQPLFDRLWHDEIWGELRAHSNAAPAWERLKQSPVHQLTPNVPNVFLALVPANQAATLGRFIAESLYEEFRDIAGCVWNNAFEAGIVTAKDKKRFDTQIDRALNISWQTQAWPESLNEACALAENAPVESPLAGAKRVETIRTLAEKTMPKDHRDKRYYTDKDKKDCLNNVGLAWSILLAHQQSQFDAVRQTNLFKGTNASEAAGRDNTKDALVARDEALVGGSVLRERINNAGNIWPTLFKKDDPIGALTLIKRTWHKFYLESVWKFHPEDFKMPNTRGIASHDPHSNGDDDKDVSDIASSEKYFAVLALDGDEIGKWVSGAKTPAHRDQLAFYSDGSGNPTEGAVPYFKRNGMDAFLDSKRALSPSYHLQFSEALSNFALRCARPIVEAFDGRLIYAGGDDVLALLPADTALRCATALRAAFRGSPELPKLLDEASRSLSFKFSVPSPGFLARSDYCDNHGKGTPIPFIVPGPAADCSVGIAIAHFKAPLQDVVREAQKAEKRAKRKPHEGGLGRSAVAISLFKHSGEITEWGCKWDQGGLNLYQVIATHLEAEALSSRFPHRVCALLEPYVNTSKSLSSAGGFNAKEVILREFEFAATRQGSASVAAALKPLLTTYLDGLTTNHCEAVIGLCTTAAFTNRTSSNS